jgi:FixJ family two-component response regulator
MSEPTVFIIDDDPSVRKGLSRLLNVAGFHTHTFNSAEDFLANWECDLHGCILLDVNMPKMTGPQLHQLLISSGCYLPVIFLTAHGDACTAATAIKKGAIDFLEKPVSKNELMAAIRVSLEKDNYLRKQRADNTLIKEQIDTLTKREHEVMTFVITGMLNKQIAAEMNISEETVKIHRGRVMQKLGITSVAELVRLCDKAGIVPFLPQKS